jgi:Na+-driven multidrug efflux pump
MSAGTVTMFLLLQITGAIRAAGNSTLPMILLIGANVLNIVLDIWLVFGGLGVPPMGVAGAAWATVIARGVFALLGLGALYRGFAGLRIRRFAWNWGVSWTILKIGIPSCAQWLVRMLSYVYVLRFLSDAAPRALVGTTEAQAAFGVGLRLDSLALFSGIGWGAAAATFVGQSLGRGLPERAVRATWIALGLNMAMMLLFAGAYVLFADPLLASMGFDTAVQGAGVDAEVVREIGRTYIFVTSSGYVFLAVAVVISQALAGAGATKFPLLIEVVGYGLVGYPLTGWMASQAGTFGLRGLWAVAVVIHLAVAVAYVLWFHYGGWAKKELR